MEASIQPPTNSTPVPSQVNPNSSAQKSSSNKMTETSKLSVKLTLLPITLLKLPNLNNSVPSQLPLTKVSLPTSHANLNLLIKRKYQHQSYDRVFRIVSKFLKMKTPTTH